MIKTSQRKIKVTLLIGTKYYRYLGKYDPIKIKPRIYTN